MGANKFTRCGIGFQTVQNIGWKLCEGFIAGSGRVTNIWDSSAEGGGGGFFTSRKNN